MSELNRKANIAISSTEKKNKKVVFVIRRSIFIIFIFFSALVMIINLSFLVFGLCLKRLMIIIDEGARPPKLLNIAIMAEAGATISLDAVAQAQNDLHIAKSFAEYIINNPKNRTGINSASSKNNTYLEEIQGVKPTYNIQPGTDTKAYN